MLFQSKKSHRGIETKCLLNNNKKTSSVLTFPSQNVVSTSNIELIENPCPAPALFLSNTLPHELLRLQIQTKRVKVLTQKNGYPRVIKVTEIVLGDKVLKLTDIYTTLPLGLNDALNSMISNNGNQENEVLNFSLLLENKRDIQANSNMTTKKDEETDLSANSYSDGGNEVEDEAKKIPKLSTKSKAIKKPSRKRKAGPVDEQNALKSEEISTN